MRHALIEIVISGAVERAGRASLEPGATVETALRAAGGLAYRASGVPDGRLVLRRRSPSSRRISVYRWSLFEGAGRAWRSFPLEPHDVLIFGWELREDLAEGSPEP
jgi:protein involved in polysaccharide export with SLBB domain